MSPQGIEHAQHFQVLHPVVSDFVGFLQIFKSPVDFAQARVDHGFLEFSHFGVGPSVMGFCQPVADLHGDVNGGSRRQLP
jgi:hypothetical protein